MIRSVPEIARTPDFEHPGEDFGMIACGERSGDAGKTVGQTP